MRISHGFLVAPFLASCAIAFPTADDGPTILGDVKGDTSSAEPAVMDVNLFAGTIDQYKEAFPEAPEPVAMKVTPANPHDLIAQVTERSVLLPSGVVLGALEFPPAQAMSGSVRMATGVAALGGVPAAAALVPVPGWVLVGAVITLTVWALASSSSDEYESLSGNLASAQLHAIGYSHATPEQISKVLKRTLQAPRNCSWLEDAPLLKLAKRCDARPFESLGFSGSDACALVHFCVDPSTHEVTIRPWGVWVPTNLSMPERHAHLLIHYLGNSGQAIVRKVDDILRVADVRLIKESQDGNPGPEKRNGHMDLRVAPGDTVQASTLILPVPYLTNDAELVNDTRRSVSERLRIWFSEVGLPFVYAGPTTDTGKPVDPVWIFRSPQLIDRR